MVQLVSIIVAWGTAAAVRLELARNCEIRRSGWKLEVQLAIQADQEAALSGHLDSDTMGEGRTNNG